MANNPRKFFLASRHKPSGGFLAAAKGYGFTREEPTLGKPPRLFVKPGAPTQAPGYWLQGEMFEGTDAEDDGTINIRCIRKPHRRAYHMELVDVENLDR